MVYYIQEVYTQKVIKIISSLIALAFLGGCGALDAILPSAGTYKVNALINGQSIDKYSIVSFGDEIQPHFEESVSDDPDVTALMVFLKNSKGDIVGGRFIYTLDMEAASEILSIQEQFIKQNSIQNDSEGKGGAPDEEPDEEEGEAVSDGEKDAAADEKPELPYYYRKGSETIIPVQYMDELPFLPLPKDLPMGWYTMVFHVQSGKENLHKSEKTFFYLADTEFSLKSIQVHLPGITENIQLIPTGMVIMLEAKLVFDTRLEPYIVWYNGKKIISEGRYSDGAWKLLWKMPDQNGFFPITVEVFPVANRQDLAGYSQEISLPVSSKAHGINLLTKDTPELFYWYRFEGNLNESKAPSITGRALVSAGQKEPQWMPAGGTYGLITGSDDTYTLPDVSLVSGGTESRKFFFSFKPLDEGGVFTVQFGPTFDVTMELSTEGENLVLSLASPLKTVSATFGPLEPDAFVTAGIDFSIQPDMIAAKLNIMGDLGNRGEPAPETITLAAAVNGDFKTTLGACRKKVSPDIDPETGQEAETEKIPQEPVFTALWDEFALLYLPLMEIEFLEEEPASQSINNH